MKLIEYFADELVHKKVSKETSVRIQEGVELKKAFDVIDKTVRVLLADEPVKGMFGYLLIVKPGTNNERSIDLRTKAYEPAKVLVVHDTWESLQEYFHYASQATIPLHKFDDPDKLRLGFVVQCATGAQYHGVKYSTIYQTNLPGVTYKDEQKETV